MHYSPRTFDRRVAHEFSAFSNLTLEPHQLTALYGRKDSSRFNRNAGSTDVSHQPSPAGVRRDRFHDAGSRTKRAISIVEERLTEEFGDRVSSEEITSRTRASLHRYHNARIKTFVPVLVHREVREDVRAALHHR